MHEVIIERALQIAFADQRLSLAEALAEAAEQVAGDDLAVEVSEEANTLADAGYLGDARGVVLRTLDGAEVHVTVALARPAR